LQKRPLIERSLLIVATPYPFFPQAVSILKKWILLVSFKLKVSFAKQPYERDDILQKRPLMLRSLLIIATLY